MEKKKRTVWHVVICVGLVCLIWGGYFAIKYYGTNRILELREDDFSWVYQVDEVGTEGKNFVLQGFAFELDVDAEKGAFEIVLQDIESGKRYFPRMEYLERSDVNDYFLCEFDYLQTGFKATIGLKKLSLDKKDYEVLIRRTGKKETFRTGTYISKGSLMHVNPKEYASLEMAGTELDEIVNNGVIRAYEPSACVYIYQYKGDLYWIAKSEKYSIDDDLYIEYLMETTQIERLPQKRLDNNWDYDNLGFYFKQSEIIGWDTGEYRVTKRALPKEYSLTKIWTGYNDGKWLWRADFRPWYEFIK